MPDTNVIIVRPYLANRQPALPGFIVRKLFAAKAKPGQQTIIEACRAELAWAKADWQRMTADYGSHDARYDGPHESETYRLPHEWAAARVLNTWGHLHPIEWRVHANLAVLRAQIKTAATVPSWTERAEATRDYMRLLLGDRRKAAHAFFAAVEEYRRLRLAIDTQVAA